MRRWIGAALAVVGLLTLVLLFVSNPPPTAYGAWASGQAEAGHLLVAKGPAIARYDADADVTRALFWCGHARCEVATTLEGDQRELVDQPSVVLYFPIAPPPRATETIAPIVLGDAEPAQNVTLATLARFEPGAAWATLSLYQGAFLALAVGVSIAANASAQRLFVEVLGLGAGLVLGTLLAPLPWTESLLPGLLLFVVGAGAVITAVSARWWPRLGHVGAFLLATFVGLLFGAVVTTDFFAHAPAV